MIVYNRIHRHSDEAPASVYGGPDRSRVAQGAGSGTKRHVSAETIFDKSINGEAQSCR